MKAIVNWLEDQHASKISQAVCKFTGHEVCGSSKRTNIARRNQTGSQLRASQASRCVQRHKTEGIISSGYHNVSICINHHFTKLFGSR